MGGGNHMIINELKINRYHCGYYSAMVSIFRFYFGLLNRVPVEGETVYVGFNEGIAALHLDEFERSHSADRVLLSAVDLGDRACCYFGEDVIDNKEAFAIDECPYLVAVVVRLVGD